MATPRADSYSVASGGTINAGRYEVSNLAAVIGDSLTEHNFASTPIYWQNGLMGAPLQMVANSGHSGQNILGLISQIENLYTAATAPGLIGLPHLGWVGLRIGTNVVRSGAELDVGNQAHYVTIINRLLELSDNVIVFPVPPIGGGGLVAKNTAVPGYNTYLQGLVSADTTGRLHWIDDCADLVDGSGNVIPDYFASDELHMNAAGTYQMGLTSEAALTSLLSSHGYGNPLVTDAADVYPAQPQWTTNPTNGGTGGTLGAGWTGSCPNGWRVETNGAGLAGSVSIVAADGGDANQTPWVRITPTECTSTAAIAITHSAAGRSITASDPGTLEQLLQVRFNNFTGYNDLTMWAQSGGARFTKQARLRWSAVTGANRTATIRQKYYRTGTTVGGTPNNYIYLAAPASVSGAMGSIDLRNWTVRG